MNGKGWNLLKFFIWLVGWTIAGALVADQLRRSFIHTYFADSGFRWVQAIIALTATGMSGGYWIYVQRMAVSGTRTRFKVGWPFHAGAFVMVLLVVGAYALIDKPVNDNWLFVLAGWGGVVAIHGILSRRLDDAPEDLFV